MTSNQRDRLVGTILLAVSLIWLSLVYETIPPVDGTIVGPRAFPLLLGGFLFILSLLMVIRSFGRGARAPYGAGHAEADEDKQAPANWLEVKLAGGIFLLIVAYGYFLERAGFRLTTALISAVALVVLLQVRRPVLILTYSVGIAVGCWLIFDKLLGAHLPVGSWTSFS
jgi:putative tricarboxylic transport membrane protein